MQLPADDMSEHRVQSSTFKKHCKIQTVQMKQVNKYTILKPAYFISIYFRTVDF